MQITSKSPLCAYFKSNVILVIMSANLNDQDSVFSQKHILHVKMTKIDIPFKL